MIKNTLRTNQYFIHVTNILHKVLDALRCSRLILNRKSQLSWIVIWLLFVVFSKPKKKKEMLKSQTIVQYLLNYIFTCCFSNLHSNIVHPNSTFSSLEPTIKPSPFWNFHFGRPWQHHFMSFPSTHEQG
jgi:hypothetical protein